MPVQRGCTHPLVTWRVSGVNQSARVPNPGSWQMHRTVVTPNRWRVGSSLMERKSSGRAFRFPPGPGWNFRDPRESLDPQPKSLNLCKRVPTHRKSSASDYTRAVISDSIINTRSAESCSCVVLSALLFFLALLARLEPAPLPIPAARIGLPQ